ncbi:hypothetical protein SCALM49S_10252 [Streptomyces californicus]
MRSGNTPAARASPRQHAAPGCCRRDTGRACGKGAHDGMRGEQGESAMARVHRRTGGARRPPGSSTVANCHGPTSRRDGRTVGCGRAVSGPAGVRAERLGGRACSAAKDPGLDRAPRSWRRGLLPGDDRRAVVRIGRCTENPRRNGEGRGRAPALWRCCSVASPSAPAGGMPGPDGSHTETAGSEPPRRPRGTPARRNRERTSTPTGARRYRRRGPASPCGAFLRSLSRMIRLVERRARAARRIAAAGLHCNSPI